MLAILMSEGNSVCWLESDEQQDEPPFPFPT